MIFKMSDEPAHEPKTENIKVYIRIRPLQPAEASSDISITNHTTIHFSRSKHSSKDTRIFKFHRIFEGNSSQLEIYQIVASPLVEQALNGYNGTIFAYGQSGTGKTFTMLGDVTHHHLKGIVPNVFSHIFAQISTADQSTSYVVTVTFLEIYNEEVRDLLNASHKNLEVRENPQIGVYVKDLSGFTVESLQQVLDLVARGNRNRSLGTTKLNDQSSRSHAIFSVLVEAKHEDGSTTFGKLNLVDLAGSERVSKSSATGDRLREAGKINLSLSVLGNVISALVDGKITHIPYRNSKLTRLLQDSLGGSCLTSMIATISSQQEYYEETSYTLMYADRVKHITNRVKRNEENKSILKSFEAKIEKLQRELEELNKKEHVVVKKKNKKTRKVMYVKEDDIEFVTIQKEKNELLEKVGSLQRKILIGGENILEKAQIQLELLEHSSKELKVLDSSQQILEEVFKSKKLESKSFERKSLSLQEEDKLLDFQLEEAERKIAKAQKILFKKESEYQNEISTLLYTNKCFAKDMGLFNYVLAKSLPQEQLEKVRNNVVWDDDLHDYRLKFVPYCGNNLKKISKEVGRGPKVKSKIKNRYIKYPTEEDGNNY